MTTVSKIGGRNWKRARADVARHLRAAAQDSVQIRHSSHLAHSKELAADISVELAATLAAVNELVAIVEANE
jgi:hypothetical protein